MSNTTTTEKLINATLMLLFGIPAAAFMDSVLWGAAGAVVGVTLVQVVYWRLYRGEKLTEVYAPELT